MRWLNKIFRRKAFKPQPKQLRIDGVRTELTPQPDDAELAAQALLESRIYGDKDQRKAAKKKKASDLRPQTSDQPHDAAYYQQLSGRIKIAHEQERRSAMRYVAYVEQELKLIHGSRLKVNGSGNHEPCTMNHEPESIATLERGLYKHQDAVEREGGDLLRRWQKCLAVCLLLEIKTKTNTDLTDDADEHQPSDI